MINLNVDFRFGEFYLATLAMTLRLLRFLIVGIALLITTWATCFVIAGTNYSWSANADAVADWLFPTLVGAVPTSLVLMPLVPFVRLRQFLKTEGFRAIRHYQFSAEKIRIETDVATAEFKWAAYREVREGPKSFLLYAGPGFANVVPKRCFSSSEQLSEFGSLVKSCARKSKLRN